MRLTAHNVYDLYCPQLCPRRCYYTLHEYEAVPPGPFEELLLRLGCWHEQRHVETLRPFVDVSMLPLPERAERTRQLVAEQTPVIYQPHFSGKVVADGRSYTLSGVPDLLLRQGGGYVVRECKLACSSEEGKHPEIGRQLQLYGYLLEQTTGSPPMRMEVYLGDGCLSTIAYDGGRLAQNTIEELARIASLPSPPYSPCGWSKCQGCVFTRLCWNVALQQKQAAVVVDVDQGLARALREEGIVTAADLLARYSKESLARVQRSWGKGSQRVGMRRARRVLLHARALLDGEPIVLAKAALPAGPNLVMFDLEGLPAYMQELEKIYLWGIKVYGDRPHPFMPAVAPIGEGGDQLGWERFLDNCERIFSSYGDLPFVHWASYEKSNLRRYIQRYGDRDGIAARVVANLVDLLSVTKEAVVIPEPSYSLKCVERLAGFQRSQTEYGGTWAMAKYIEAVETANQALRENIIKEILIYNEEDLDATWAVQQWLARLAG